MKIIPVVIIFITVIMTISSSAREASLEELAVNSSYKLGLFGGVMATCQMAYFESNEAYFLLEKSFPSLKMSLFDSYLKGQNESIKLYHDWLRTTPTGRTPDNECLTAKDEYLNLQQRIKARFAH